MADENTTTAPAGSQGAATAPTAPAGDALPEGLGEAGKKALTTEREARREAERLAADAKRQFEQAATELQQFRDRDKTDAEKLAERATTAETTAASATSKLLRYEVAAEKNLPLSMAARLQGSTKEELLADADNLTALLASQMQAAAPNYDGGVRTAAPEPTDMNARIRQQAGRQ